jgi:hypothetical protein
MVESIRVNSMRIRGMVKEDSDGRTEEFIKANGRMGNSMVSGFFRIMRILSKGKENGTKAKGLNGLRKIINDFILFIRVEKLHFNFPHLNT